MLVYFYERAGAGFRGGDNPRRCHPEECRARQSDSFASWDPPVTRPKLHLHTDRRKGRHDNQRRHDRGRGIRRRRRRHAGRPRSLRSRRKRASTSSRPRPTGRRSEGANPPARCGSRRTRSSRREPAPTSWWSSAGPTSPAFAERSRSHRTPSSSTKRRRTARPERPRPRRRRGRWSGSRSPSPRSPALPRDSQRLEEHRHARHPRRAPGPARGDARARPRAPIRAQEGGACSTPTRRAFAAGPRIRGLAARGRFARRRLDYAPSAPRLLMSGNEAAAIGALHAGCRFFAGYPITPSSEILHFLAEWMPRAGGRSSRPRTSSRRSAPSSAPPSPASRR